MLKKTLHAGLVAVTALFAACSLPPAVAQEYTVLGTFGTRNAHRGSTTWIDVSQGWYKLYDFTVDTSTNYVTAPGHDFTTGVLAKVVSTESLPFPLTSSRSFYVCDVSGDRFRLANYESSSCASTSRVDFRDAGLGQLKIGRKVIHNTLLIDPVLEGLPSGVTAEIWCGQSAKCPVYGSRYPGKVYNYGAFYAVIVKLQISTSAPLGPVTLGLKLEPISASARRIDIPLHIHEVVPVRLASATAMASVSIPAIPGLAKWESSMKTLAAKWCKVSNPTEVMGFGLESQVWTYDGANVYYQIADYLKTTSWRACGTNIARQYRDYVIANKGKIPGWRVFTRGLGQAYRLTGNKTYLDAVRYLALEGLYAQFGGGVRDDLIRETAYMLDAMVTYEKLTGTRAPKLIASAELLLGIFDQLFVSNTFVYQQIFMDGLAMRALIDYWGLTRDPRVPVAIKTALDWIWDRAWLSDSNKMTINPEPFGPRCDWGCRSPNTDLINLAAPAYAWYWSITGDRTYLDRGDVLFSHALDGDTSYSGKIFSQNYTWSFDYVRWRTGSRPTR